MKKPVLLRVLGNILYSDAGRAHPLRSCGRFAFLQLRRRLGPSPFVYRTATGTKALVERQGDFSGVTHLFYVDFPDLQENAFACHALRKEDVFWDVGANQGYWSILLAGRGVEAHAFEPGPTTFRNQAKQFAAQASPFRERLHGYNMAMGPAVGKMRFASDMGQANHLLLPGEQYAGEIIEVEVTSMDEFARRRKPNFIKIDVEGWTAPVLEGGSATLASPDLLGLVIETFRFADGATPEMRKIEAVLAKHGFRPFSYDPRKRVLTELRNLKEGRQDTIYARNDAKLRERLASAEPIVCFGEKI